MPRLPPAWRDILKGDVLALGIRLEVTKGRARFEELLCGKPLKDAPAEPAEEAQS
ncbi:MAG: hypothetical protein HYV15_02730 [Elusimicrobia bacterium]|nr:hypothetical protein [Elusimicrobiota bacterium]